MLGKGSGTGDEVLESLTLVYLLSEVFYFITFMVITMYSLSCEQLADAMGNQIFFFLFFLFFFFFSIHTESWLAI